VSDRRTGTAAGVPYLAVPPPEGTENPGLVAVLHGLDHPNSEETMAATLPLQDVPAWRVYLGLPMSGKRSPEGGSEEIMRRASEDALMNVQAPVMEQAAEELPRAIEDLRRQLGVEDDADTPDTMDERSNADVPVLQFLIHVHLRFFVAAWAAQGCHSM